MSNARFGLRVRNGLVKSITEGLTAIDADALAFINATGITDSIQVGSINTLVIDLKNYGLWTKIKAIYPFVGGTASTHKFNLKDPRDLDIAFRLVFNGGWTHNANGALPNGTNGYANTFLKPNDFAQNSISGGAYINSLSISNSQRSDVYFGSANTSFNNGYYLLPMSGAAAPDTLKDFSRSNTNSAPGTLSWTDCRGFYQIIRNTSTNYMVMRNNTSINYSISSVTPNSLNIYVSALNLNSSATEYSYNRVALIYFADGFTNSEANNLYTAVQVFQTTLNRQI